jgi:hypothetical protein
MPTSSPAAATDSAQPSWSERLLLLSSAGILFLTLFPFRFALHMKSSEGMFPFFHGIMGKNAGPLDIFLNVLLFMPFGFGLAENLREKAKSRAFTLAMGLGIGALFSYTVEVLQIYIPTRDSGWTDVITNSTGSVFGVLIYEFCAAWLLRGLRAAENALERWFQPLAAAVCLLIYFAVWFAGSLHLQSTTRLQGWDPTPILVVGNDTWTRPWQAWHGQVRKLEFWDRALPAPIALAVSAGASTQGPVGTGIAPVAVYDLSPGAPPRDRMNFLPALAWRPPLASSANVQSLELAGHAWLVSDAATPQLVESLEHSNRFSIHILCVPAESTTADQGDEGRILSIGRATAPADLSIRQVDTGLVFAFRTPLSARHSQLGWLVPNVFAAGQPRDMVYTYDGANLLLFIDGAKQERPYILGAGPALARTIRRIKPAELEGYRDIYYALMFFPAGIVLGIAVRNIAGRQRFGAWLALATLLAAVPWLLEDFLARAGNRPFLAIDVALAFGFFLTGALWINARQRPNAAEWK